MSKAVLKLVVFCLLLTGGFLCLSSGHAAAATAQNKYGCGTGPSTPPAPPGGTTTWGNARAAPNQNQMASIIVYAQDSNNNPLNVSYKLNSPDGQIYSYQNGGYKPGSATASITSSTGEYIIGDGGYQCNGWDVIGPGIDGQDGNGYVVNCDNGNHYKFPYYIVNIAPPLGQSNSTGKWAEYFQGTKISSDVNGGGATGGAIYPINAVNGGNVYVNLVWTQNPNLVGDSEVDGQHGTINVAPNTLHKFTHTVTNMGGSSVSYNWSVVGNVPGGKPSGSASNIGPNGSNPKPGNPASDSFTPTSSMVGNTYCEHIQFASTDGSGQNGSSTQACVRVTNNPTPTPPPSHTFGCSGIQYTYSVGKNDHPGSQRQYIQVSGTDSDSSGYYVAPVSTDGNGTVTYSLNVSYTALAQTIHVYTHRYTWNGSAWAENADSPVDHSYGCYHATCNVTGVQGTGPSGEVLAGQSFKVFVTVTNDNTDPSAETIPSNAGGHDFSVTESPDDYQGSYVHNPTGFSADPPSQPGGGQPVGPKEIDFSGNGNSSQVRQMTLNFFPDFADYGSLGSPCSTTFSIYQKFGLGNEATSASLDDKNGNHNAENPSQVDYYTDFSLGIDSSGGNATSIPAVHIATPNMSTYTAVGVLKDSFGGGDYGVSDHEKWTGNSPDKSVTAGPNSAGNQYYACLTLPFTSGYIGPGGSTDIRDPSGSYSNCGYDHVTNEPYFKAKGAGGIAADVKQVAKPNSSGTFTCSGSSPSSSGLLAGWNDNADPAGADRGASSELNALALLKITGVASNQPASTVTNSTTQLTFANAGQYIASDNTAKPVQTSPPHTDSPSLGGNYGGSGNSCVTPPAEPTDVSKDTRAGSFTVDVKNSLNGTTPHYQYGTSTSPVNVTLTDGVGQISQPDTKVYVNGNVYIKSDTTYSSTTGWTYDPGNKVDSIPSFTLYASGDIFIDPGVTQLDGTYISAGKIYTCGTSPTTPCPASSLFNGANNQLVVNGSFVASQVKMLRTFGSLRDEKPTVSSGTTGTGIQWSSCGAYGNPKNGESCLSASPSSLGLTCTGVTEPGDPNGWTDNILCLPNGSSLKLAWTYCGDTAADHGKCDKGRDINGGTATVAYLKAHGYPYCTSWSVPETTPVWDDNWLCMNQARDSAGTPKLQFELTNDTSQTCIPISEVADSSTGSSDNSQNWAKGYYLCEPKVTGPSISPPSLTQCSNAGTWIDHTTCAAEVFRLSPEMYLTKPESNGNGSSSSGGYDTITSLPPVL